MTEMRRTVLHDWHVKAGAKMVEFGGWEMPLNYAHGIFEEHLQTRQAAGLFDVSHMGRFILRGPGALAFLQHVLTNNAAALEVGQAQYTMVPDPEGGAIDDAYLYRFVEGEYLLVVNAANRQKDWDHFQSVLATSPKRPCRVGDPRFKDVQLTDRTDELAMISLQGPLSKQIITAVLDAPTLPEPRRNALCLGSIQGEPVQIARTGYTGEPLCFELFLRREDAVKVWSLLVDRGAQPVGLGARDTLRLEAGLPLYGHELGTDTEGKPIPIFACPLARFAVSFSPLKGDFVGREPLARQYQAYQKIVRGEGVPRGEGSPPGRVSPLRPVPMYIGIPLAASSSSAAAQEQQERGRDALDTQGQDALATLSRIVMPVAVFGKAVARAGAKVFSADGSKHVGYVTSGTAVPYWKSQDEGLAAHLTDEKGMRGVALALLDSRLRMDTPVSIDVRGRKADGVIVPCHLRSEAPPYARPMLYGPEKAATSPGTAMPAVSAVEPADKVRSLLEQAARNTVWRQRECINLIPSEMTTSPMVRLLSAMDPSFRYAEHKAVKAFDDAEVFYYQGTDFIQRVEELLAAELTRYLGAAEVETRVLSGQMANAVVFSAMVDYLNRARRREEPRRIRCAMNHAIIRGGHLSSQPMGALRDFIAHDPATEAPAAVNFPVLKDNPYRIDVAATAALIEKHRPELIIFGKSLVLHPEPVAEVRKIVDSLGTGSILMYDMAHVLGLVGPHFQEPFREGADLVTGSTHKTFFGTQRGLVATRLGEADARWPLWEAVQRRTFPGAVSNHHLGTLLGLLMAAYEMNHFKDEYQQAVLANAKAFAKALKDCGLEVAGDPACGYTQTHQVLLSVGYAQGPAIARRLEENNIIVNYQAGPREEGFTAAGFLRMGVAEMTRFGMAAGDFAALAQLVADVVARNRPVAEEVTALRQRFLQLRYCFSSPQYEDIIARLHSLVE